MPLPCRTVFLRHNGCRETGVMTLPSSGMPWRKKGSDPAFQDGDPEGNLSNTTGGNTNGATVSGHVRKDQGLAAGRNPLRQMPDRHLLAMSPKPNQGVFKTLHVLHLVCRCLVCSHTKMMAWIRPKPFSIIWQTKSENVAKQTVFPKKVLLSSASCTELT